MKILKKISTLVLLACLSPGCDGLDDGNQDEEPTLPVAWRQAQLVDSWQGPCRDWDMTQGQTEVSIGAALTTENETIVVVDDLVVNCIEDYHVYQKKSGDSFELLLEPTEVVRQDLALCSCAYRIYVRMTQPVAGDEIVVSYRQSMMEEPADPAPADVPVEELGRAEVVDASLGEVSDTAVCSVDSPCEDEGSKDADGRYTWGCHAVPELKGAFCIWDAAMCFLSCGTPDCAIMESFPPRANCSSQE